MIAALRPQPAESSRQEAEEIELTAFVARIERLAAALQDVPADDPAAAPSEIPAVLRVRTEDGTIDVVLEPLRRELAGRDLPSEERVTRTDRVRAQLMLLGSEAEALAGGGETPAFEEGRRSLAGILERREFARQQPSRGAALLERIRTWLLDLWSRMGGDRIEGRNVALVVVWLATAAAVAGALVWAFRAARRDPLFVERPLAASPPPVPLTARAWALRALDAARNGQTREAVRSTYRAAVTRLEEQGVWRVDDARTGREYLTLLPAGDRRRERLSDIVGQLERAVYGSQPVSRDDFERLAAHLEALGCVGPRTQPI